MSEGLEKKWIEEFEELNTLQFDNLSQYEREEKIYLAACKERQEEIQKRDELLEQAIVLLTQNTHKLSQEQWLKQYEEMKR